MTGNKSVLCKIERFKYYKGVQIHNRKIKISYIGKSVWKKSMQKTKIRKIQRPHVLVQEVRECKIIK